MTKQEIISNGKKENLFNKCLWKYWRPTCRMKWDTFLTFTTMDSKLMKDLNVSQETIRILRRTQAAPFLPQLQPLLDVSPEARENKGK